MEISPRVDAYIKKNFPPDESEMLREELSALDGIVLGHGSEFEERIAAAILICIKEDFYILDRIIAAAESDWRDVLFAAGLENRDWRLGVDALLSEYEETEPLTQL